MKFPALLLAGAIACAASAPAQMESPNTNSTPPGAQQLPTAMQPQPETFAPAQPQTKSAKGGQSPNGANGVNLKGKAITKGPSRAKGAAASAAAAPSPVAQNTQPVKGASGPSTPPPGTPKPSILDDYLSDLGASVKLTADEKKAIQGYYQADMVQMAGILGNATLSPLRQAQQVSDARDQCLTKVETLLAGTDRLRDFLKIEAEYRVALIEAAATKPETNAANPALVPTPTTTFPGEASAAPNPDVQPK